MTPPPPHHAAPRPHAAHA